MKAQVSTKMAMKENNNDNKSNNDINSNNEMEHVLHNFNRHLLKISAFLLPNDQSATDQRHAVPKISKMLME